MIMDQSDNGDGEGFLINSGWNPLAAAVLGHVRGVARKAVDFVFPPLCAGCNGMTANNATVCPDCWNALSFIEGGVCDLCGFPFVLEAAEGTLCLSCRATPRTFDRTRSALLYDDTLAAIIVRFKHGERTDLAPLLANMTVRAARDARADIVCPVPIHRRRLFSRGYNQAALLSAAVAKTLGLPHIPDLLVRGRDTGTQGGLSRKGRRRNVRAAFSIPAGRVGTVAGRSILLVDDVFTTGATVDECARALKGAGAARVEVVTLARVPGPSA